MEALGESSAEVLLVICSDLLFTHPHPNKISDPALNLCMELCSSLEDIEQADYRAIGTH